MSGYFPRKEPGPRCAKRDEDDVVKLLHEGGEEEAN